MGARTKDLLLMEDQFRELLDEDHIHITTDDGSYGEQGVVTAPLASTAPTSMPPWSTGMTFVPARPLTVPKRASPSRPMRKRAAHATS